MSTLLMPCQWAQDTNKVQSRQTERNTKAAKYTHTETQKVDKHTHTHTYIQSQLLI